MPQWQMLNSNSEKVETMGDGFMAVIEPQESEIGRPWEEEIWAGTKSPVVAEADDPFDDFDEDDFDDDFDDDFEEDWEDDLTEDEEFPDTFGGDEEDEGSEEVTSDSPFSDDPDFDTA